MDHGRAEASGSDFNGGESMPLPPPQTISEPVQIQDLPPGKPDSDAKEDQSAREPVKSRPAPQPAAPLPAESADVPKSSPSAPPQPEGNVSTPGSSSQAPPATAPARVESAPVSVTSGDVKRGRYHVLQKGETLYGLARQYNVNPQKLIEINQFKDPNVLPIGTLVIIPD